jgi:molybdopterin converting factor small subunit
MTMTAYCEVTDVSGSNPVEVTLEAHADQTVTPFPNSNQTVSGIVMNTEGNVRVVRVTMELDQDSTPLKTGDKIIISASFQGQPVVSA